MRTVVAAIVMVCALSSFAHAEREYWLWAIDGRFVKSKKPCAKKDAKSIPEQLAIIDFIGDDTYVVIDGDNLSLKRGKRKIEPDKRYVNADGEPISIWYESSRYRTWIVSVTPKTSPAFATVTLVIERNAERNGEPKCFERWMAPVSP